MQTRVGNYNFVSNNCCQTEPSCGNPVRKSDLFQQMRVCNELAVTCERYLSVLTPNHCSPRGVGNNQIKVMGGRAIVVNFDKNPLRGARILFFECDSHIFTPKTAKKYQNELTDLFFRLGTLKGTAVTLAVVILDFSMLRGAKPRILTPKRYDDHPPHFYMPPPPQGSLFQCGRISLN